jgi:hypothetical protein
LIDWFAFAKSCKEPVEYSAPFRCLKVMMVAGAFVLIVGGAEGAAVACSAPTGALNQSNLSTTLESGGRIACDGSPGNWENQEIHSAGTLTDYKKGPTDPVDPTTTVGSYSINSSGIITYNYGPGSSFAFYVVPEAGTTATTPGAYDFYEGADGNGGPCTSFVVVKVESSPGSGCS